jgi:hypothetical protein
VRSDVFHAVGGFCEDRSVLPAEDWDLWIRIAERHPVRVCREPLVSYRLHAEGVSRNFVQMNRARRSVLDRALRLERGRTLDNATRRRIFAQTWLANGWDARRHAARRPAAACYARAIACRPLHPAGYRELAKLVTGRV